MTTFSGYAWRAAGKHQGKRKASLEAEMYSIVFQQTPNAILVMSLEGRILECNPAAERLFGVSSEYLRDKSIFSLLPDEHKEKFQDIIQTELLLGSVFLRIPMRLLHRAVFPVELTLRRAEIDGAECILAFITDVSDSQRVERVLERRGALLETTRDIGRWFLHTSDWRKHVPDILARLGEVLQSDEVNLYRVENASGKDAPLRAVREFCWPPVSRSGGGGGECRGTVVVFAAQGVERWAQVLRSGYPVRGRLDSFLPEEQRYMMRRGAHYLTLVPVFLDSRWWGVLEILSYRSHALCTPTDVENLQIIADMLGNAMQRQIAEQRLQHRQQALALLSDITTAALQNPSFQEPLQALARHLSDLVRADGCYITLWDNDHQRPVPMVGYGALQDTYTRIRPSSGKGSLTKYLLERGRSIFIENLQESTLLDSRWKLDPHVRTVLAIPMQGAGTPLGAVFLAYYRTYHLPAEDRALAEQAVQQVSLALSRLRLLNTTQRQLEELTILQRASAITARTLSEEDLLENFTETVGEVFYSDHFSIFLLDENREMLRLWAHYREGRLHLPPLLDGVPVTQGIIGQVARTGRPYRCGDVRSDPHYVAFNRDTLSEVCVPIQAGAQVIGVLNAESTRLMAFDEADERLLSTLAGHLGTALMRQRLFAAETQRRQEAETLQKVSAALRASLNLQNVLRDILTLLEQVVPYDSASIIMMDRSDGRPRIAAARGAGQGENWLDLPPKALPETPHIHNLLKRQQPVIIDDVNTCPDWLPVPGTEHIRCWMGVPLMVQDRVLGWLNLDKAEPGFYDDRMANLALAFANQAAIALENARLYNELETSYLQTVLSLARAVDARDSYTAGHSNRMAEMVRALAQRMGCSLEEIQAVEWAALLHDIGKIGIPDHILRKPDPLDEEEWEIMQRHPAIGAEILTPVQRLARVVPIVRSHQEKFDGSGYPAGLRGEEIPLGARILAVVDAYSAITDERVYRKARSREDALEEIRRCAGTHFDPRVVEVFLDLMAAEEEQ